MIKISTAVEASELTTRFADFFDAVIVDVHLSWPLKSAGRYGVITLLAQEGPQSANVGEWHTVVLRVDGLNGYRLAEGPAGNMVLSDGLQLHGVGEGDCVLDLLPSDSGWSDEPESWVHYLSGLSCSYEIRAYAE